MKETFIIAGFAVMIGLMLRVEYKLNYNVIQQEYQQAWARGYNDCTLDFNRK